MLRIVLMTVVLLVPHGLVAGERVSATNFYVVNQEDFDAGEGIFWIQDNVGTFTVSEGPIEPGFVRCVGSGFGGPGGVSGDGVCIYGEGVDTFTMRWKVERFGENSWQIVEATGKYAGMTGSGTTRTRLQSKFLKLKHRVSDWVGEIKLPNAD